MILTRADSARVRGIAREIRTFSDDGRPALERVLQPMMELLGSHTAASYRVESDGTHVGLQYVYAVGDLSTRPVEEVMTRSIANARGRFGFFDPFKPEPRQRNKVLRLGTTRALLENSAVQADRLRKLGIEDEHRAATLDAVSQYAKEALEPLGAMDQHQMRTLVCDGPTLLAWVGCFSGTAHDARAEAALQRLVPALSQRLKLESEIRVSRFQSQCLSSALDAIGGPAAICTSDAHVMHANQAARARIDLGDGSFTELVRDSIAKVQRGEAPTAAEVSQLTGIGMRPSYLIVLRAPPKDMAYRLREATRRWGFTSRQLEVLALLVAGEMNRTIATSLSCSERTVEIHVTNIFDRMGVDCRSAAVARFYEET